MVTTTTHTVTILAFNKKRLVNHEGSLPWNNDFWWTAKLNSSKLFYLAIPQKIIPANSFIVAEPQKLIPAKCLPLGESQK